jgi:hypothetical protein
VLQKASEEVAECLRQAADAEACADDTNDPKGNAEYQRIAESWRTLARGYEFQGALGRFISFVAFIDVAVFVRRAADHLADGVGIVRAHLPSPTACGPLMNRIRRRRDRLQGRSATLA